MKVLFSFVVIMIILNSQVFAQLTITSFPFARQTTNVKSLSLGNATVSLSGLYGDININPAGAGVEETLQFTGYKKEFSLGWYQSEFSGNYKFEHSALAFSIRKLTAGEVYLMAYPYINNIRFNSDEIYVNAGYSYTFGNSLKVGTALNYLHTEEAAGSTATGQKFDGTNTWSMDFGIQYESKLIQTHTFDAQPKFGLSLTDFGDPTDYIYPDTKDPLPTTLRAGIGFTATLNKKTFGQNFAELTLLQSASKILARYELRTTSTDTSISAMNPFKELFKSWGDYQFFNGSRMQTISPGEQIWFHTGIELKLLETLALRWGHENTGKIEERMSFHSFGAGIDLYYLAVDYAFIKYIANEYANHDPYENYLKGHHWQFSARIPLDGKRPDTILNVLFD